MQKIADFGIGGETGAVPTARRLVRDALGGHLPDVVADAELVVSELATNAALHGEPPIRVRVLVDPGVRIEVEDAGRSAPIVLQQSPDAMTGRGLAMVGALASDWGVEPSEAGGKVVWAELGGRPTAPPVPTEVDIEALLAAWSDDDADELVTVRLGDVPTDLLLAAKSHIDNVVREFVLLREGEASSGVALAPEIAALVETVTVDFADARSEIKRQAAAAAARGDAITDLELHLSPAAAEAGERYLAALDEADRYARSAHLLTTGPPRVHRLFRQWYVGSLVAQLRAHAAGRRPERPRPFPVVLAEEFGRLSDQVAASSRLALLQKVTTELAEAATVEEAARIVVDNAVGNLAVETARVRLLTDGVLRSLVWTGRGGRTGDPMPEIPLDSDLPAAVAARTRRPVFMRSLAQTAGGIPELVGYYPPNRSGHAMPLAVGDRTLGVLTLTFYGGEMTDDAQVAFVEALSDALASTMRRLQLAAADAAQRETLAFLAEATEILISAREPDEVVERLVSLAVPRLGEWCTVYLADPGGLRRVAMAIDGFPGLADELKGSVIPLDADAPATRAFRSGHTEVVSVGAGGVLEDLYPQLDFAAIGGDPALGGEGLCVPLVLRDERIGVIGLTLLRPGRHVTPDVVEAVTGLAARSAIALDDARRWDERERMVAALVSAVLPAEPPVVRGVEFAARYRPAAGEVAGDWWETDCLPDGSVLIGLGDAAGHGLPAVSRMSELRHGARALAVVEPSPGRILDALNTRFAGTDDGFGTAVYGRYDPATGELVWASAGHLPPLHVRADGTVAVVADRPGPPLGSPSDRPMTDHRLRLAPGEALVLYSDGVVERRRRPVESGVEHLVSVVAAQGASDASGLADAIIDSLCEAPSDDCCVLIARRSVMPTG